MKNLMPEIAKLLGVEIGEEFKVKQMPHDIYKFDEDSNFKYYCKEEQEWAIATTDTLYSILNGNYEIIKLPWKPKFGEYVWLVFKDDLCHWRWENLMSDFVYFKLGNCFRTKEEAEANADRIRKEIMGI